MKVIFLCALMFSSFSYAKDSSNSAFKIKQKYEKFSYNVKLHKENEMRNLSKLKLMLTGEYSRNECVAWVYLGSATRAEAIKACRGVESMDCLNWVYQGSATREQSAKACRGVASNDCLNWVYLGSASRAESASACYRVSDMECVKTAYLGSSTREQSAKLCADDYRCDNN